MKPVLPTPPVKIAPRVPILCQRGTVLCLGCGPSLKLEDIEYSRSRVDVVIAVNNAWTLAPWANALIASDAAWWLAHRCVKEFPGLKYCLEPLASVRCSAVTTLRRTGEDGIETDPTGLRTGRNSGGAAINLAVHFGAARIILLGYDMDAPRGEKHAHFFGAHQFPLRGGSPYPVFRRALEKMVAPLAALNVSVVNCSRQTALTCFPTRLLRDELP